MAYKFQVGEARLSGSLVREGAIDFKDSAGVEFNLRVGANDGVVDISRHNGSDEGLKLAGTLVTADAGEINLLDGSSAGTVVNSKAVIYSNAGVVQATDFKGPDGFEIGNASVSDFLTFGADTITVKNGALDFDIASHDGSNGLKLEGTLVTSTAAELNLVDGSSAGTAVASKAVIYNATKGINAVQITSSWYSGGKFTSEVDLNSNNLIGIADLDVAGAATFLGNVDLGNADSDTITATGQFDSDLVPSTDSARNLGSNAKRWSTIYVDSIVGADIALDVESYGDAPLGTTISGSTDFALLKKHTTTYTLPGAVAGKILHVKLSGSVHNATLNGAAGDSIEDGTSILLESTGSAVTLAAYDATHWFII